MNTKKTMLFIAAMLGCIMVSSLTSCGDESIENAGVNLADSCYSLRVMKYSSEWYVQTVIASVPEGSDAIIGTPVLFHRSCMKDFTFYEGDTLDVKIPHIYKEGDDVEAINYPGVPDSLHPYVTHVIPFNSTPVRPLFKNVSSVYYLADGFFNVELLKKHNGSYVWRAVVNRIPDNYTGSMVVVHDTINSFIIPNNIDDSYPMSVGDTLCVRLARYVSSLGETTDWTVKGLDDTHRTITKTLFGHFGY